MVVPANIQNILLNDFNKIRIGTNELVTDKYVFIRPARLLYEELVTIKNWFNSSIQWDSIIYDIEGDDINISLLKYFIAKIFADQKNLRDRLSVSTGQELVLPYEEEEDRFPVKMSVFREDYFDNNILNRPYYRLYRNNSKLSEWVENFNNYDSA